MKRLHRLFPLLGLVLAAPAAHAAGLALRWDNCYADGGVINKNIACDTNDGSETLIGSVFVTKSMLTPDADEFILRLASAGASLPQWWAFGFGFCRSSAPFISTTPPASAVNCEDWSNGNAVGGLVSYVIADKGSNTAMILGASAIPQSVLRNLPSGQEYFVFRLLLQHSSSVGTGSCAGCETPVCISFSVNRMQTAAPFAAQYIDYPINGTDSNYVTWQGGGGITSPLGVGCPAATPVRQRSWSAVKTLYQ
jgi:hypothetical protein